MALTLQKAATSPVQSRPEPDPNPGWPGLGPARDRWRRVRSGRQRVPAGANGKVRGEADFIFYNQLRSQDGSVEHTGDNRTGAGDGDDEVIKVDLSRVPADIDKIAFTVTIHDAEARKQNFGKVSNSFIRVVNETSGAEVVRYDLAEDASTETAMIFAELYRSSGEWKFRAVGQGYAGGLRAWPTATA